MWVAVIVPVILQVAAPIGLVLWLARGRVGTWWEWLLRVILAGSWVLATGLAGLWLVFPWYTPLALAAGVAIAAVISLRRRSVGAVPPPARFRSARIALLGTFAVVAAATAGFVLTGRRVPPETVDLAFPLRGGPYLVVNGGANGLVNGHVMTLEGERYRPWRGQSFGVDIIKLGPLGFRARGVLPHDPRAYVIFGEPVYAPCAGDVLEATDGLPDMAPPQTDRRHLAGNHVVLRCDAVWVLLGHLQQNSVQVHPGERVQIGRPIGRAGNSGNTGEPHLHIHAQRPGTAESPLSGSPLPVRLDGTYPIRNQRLYGRVP